MPDEKPLVIVSKSEPHEAVPKLCALGLNAVSGEAGSDYVWYPRSQQWAIERKTVSNLLGSLSDRQLVEQTHRGSEQFDRYIILIEGEYKRAPSGMLSYHSPGDPRRDSSGWVESKWQFAAIFGMLFALQMVGTNVSVVNWPVMYDSPYAIASIVASSSTARQGFTSERQRPDLPPTAALGGKLYGDALWALCALPGCGPEVAAALLGEYGTLAETVHVLSGATRHITPADVKVNGKRIGEKRIAKIREAVLTKF